MDKIGVTEVRKVLLEVLEGYLSKAYVMKKNDEELLKTDLYRELSIDSLDVQDMFDTLYQLYDIDIDTRYVPRTYTFFSKPTVENFIIMVNDCIAIDELSKKIAMEKLRKESV